MLEVCLNVTGHCKVRIQVSENTHIICTIYTVYICVIVLHFLLLKLFCKTVHIGKTETKNITNII